MTGRRNVCSRVWNWLRAVDVRAEAEFKQAEMELERAKKFASSIEVESDIDYGWVRQYTKDTYERVCGAVEGLDAKADSIIQYISALAALVTAALVYGSKVSESVSEPVWMPAILVLSAAPFFAFSVSAIYIAVTARTPKCHCHPPRPEDAIQFAEYHGSDAETLFIGQYAGAATGMIMIGEEKAYRIQRAYKQFTRAMIALSLPWLARIIALVWVWAVRQ